MMRTLILPATVIMICLAGCGQKTGNNKPTTPDAKPQPTGANSVNVKVYLDATGRLFVNGNIATHEALDTAIIAIKPKNGTIFYSRGNATGTPPANVDQVVDVMAKHGLPIQFYTDSSFTQVAQLN